MKFTDPLKNSAILTALLTVFTSSLSKAQEVTLDGFYDASNADEVLAYATTESVNWKNGHGTQNDYWYDPATGWSKNQTTIRYGSGTLAGGDPNTTYYFLYVEAPLEIKGMSWSKDSSRLDDYYLYVLGGQYIHQEPLDSTKPHISKLEFSTATGSEKVEFGNYVGEFEEDGLLDGKIDGSGDGLIGLADSIDYLLANPSLLEDQNGGAFDLGTDQLKNSTSINPDIPMAFEFQFGTEQQLDDAVAAARAGIVIHLSPSKIPEPTSALLLGISSIVFLLRRKRH